MRRGYVPWLVAAGALPVVMGPLLPTSDLALAVGSLAVLVVAAAAHARWLNGDEGWDLRLLLTRDAWLHPWATRKQAQRANAEPPVE